MTKAFENATKMRAWVDPVGLGADPTGVLPSDASFAQAIAAGLPVKLPPGTFRLSRAIAKTLAAGQDFVLIGAGPESTRLVFESGGLAINYNAPGKSFGDATSIMIRDLGIETEGAGTSDAVSIVNSANVMNDTEGNVSIDNLSISGTSSNAYWVNGVYMQNVAFPHLGSIKVEDGQRRTVALSLATTGSYNAVDITVNDFKCWEPLTAIQVRGRCEGLYLNQFVAIGCQTGVDWTATISAGKKPLLLLDGCHINTSGTAVKTTDVAQVLASASLIYIANSASKATYGFDFQATSGASSENSRIDGVTIIGQGDRTNSLAVGVRCGTNVFGVAVEATMDNLGTCVETVEVNRTTISPGSRLSNYNTRSIGMYSAGGMAGGPSGGVSVDGSLQAETSGADSYSRDVYREQLRARSFTFTASAASEVLEHELTLPFRTDTSVVVACWGTDPNLPGATVYPDLPECTKDKLVFRTEGLTAGSPYRINYIAYGY